MNVIVNGQAREVPESSTIEQLLQTLDLGAAACAVEINAELVPKRRHIEHELNEGDTIEIVSLVGGG